MSEPQSVEVDLDELRARMQRGPITEAQIDLLFALIEAQRQHITNAETAQRAWTEAGAKAQADNAALRAAAEIVRAEYSALLERPLPDVYAVMQHLRWPVGHLALTAELHTAGAQLAAELEAARAVVAATREAVTGTLFEARGMLVHAVAEYDWVVQKKESR